MVNIHSEPVKCFLLTKTDMFSLYLRRYTNKAICKKPSDDRKHCDANYFYETVKGDKAIDQFDLQILPFPNKCTHCGYKFEETTSSRMVHTQGIWRREDTGEAIERNKFPVGAIFDADWYHDCSELCGPDGKCMCVQVPGGHLWMIDSRAGNCTMPDDTKHKCWVRHGEAPNLTVDKNGLTCQAGAGSIQTENWHGFLTNGILSENR